MEICVIIMKTLKWTDIDEKVVNLLGHQKYQSWKQIMFVNASSAKPDNLKTELPGKGDKRFVFLNSSPSLVRNIEMAATHHCSKESYAILLNPGEVFNNPDALTEIARQTSPRDIVGGFIPISWKGKLNVPRPENLGLENSPEPTIYQLQ